MERNIENINLPILNILKKVFPQFDRKELNYTNVVIPKEQAWGTYKIRYNIAVENRSFDNNSLKLYESALEKLEDFNEDSVSIHLFYYNNGRCLLVFSDVDDKNVIGYFMLEKKGE